MRLLRVVVPLCLMAALTACGGGGTPGAGGSDSPTDCYPSATLATDAMPSAATTQPQAPCGSELPEAEESETSEATGTSTGTATATTTTAADVGCLTSKTWHISKPDMESQMEHLMESKMRDGAQVDSVQIVSGDQTLTVTPGLRATFTDNTVTEIRSHFSASGVTINELTKQTHAGNASGDWKAAGPILTPQGNWSGQITGTTQVTVNGRSRSAPFSSSEPDGWADLKINYSCADGSLMLTIPGKSPFSYLFR